VIPSLPPSTHPQACGVKQLDTHIDQRREPDIAAGSTDPVPGAAAWLAPSEACPGRSG
jgi:hypothetical protein